MKKVIVLSLGGSLIIPDGIDVMFLRKFKKIISKNRNKYRFVIVCGGGSIARKYISALKKEGINEKLQSYSGISATRTNARFMSYFFNQDPETGIPTTISEVKRLLLKTEVLFCGALEYKPNQTSDSTSAEIAKELRTIFINLTDVSGLYDKNPKKFKNAKFIPKIGWKDFQKMAGKMKYKPGQHFVLDQTAANMIMKNKITTYILGKDMGNLDNFLKRKKFRGTMIGG